MFRLLCGIPVRVVSTSAGKPSLISGVESIYALCLMSGIQQFGDIALSGTSQFDGKWIEHILIFHQRSIRFGGDKVSVVITELARRTFVRNMDFPSSLTTVIPVQETTVCGN